ncbi:hypothetical protein RirG_014740 [Rhizophagus irregularis DAOM 197198w]|uniref:Uncharacterized protein n=1 Tax=Rhizophagus irregularis (strain DAOM 197198w) TaxID=1432141 RepID=A0A015NGG8_RHIIW|nr:hypothetical protein RirG_014740 [Rhizophagus irregularis DAOM 197198w]EXX78464.1 hypothetical protein RirG_014740 [Rhizophagus irregularis DAOM 197198w]
MPIDLLPISKLKHLDTILQTRIRQLNLIHHITKGYYRRAAANMNLCKFKDALRDFRIVRTLFENRPRPYIQSIL